MRHELKDLITTLTELQTRQRGSCNANGVRRLFDERFQRRRDRSVCIWCLLALELWHRNFPVARPFENDQAQAAMGEGI